MEWDAVQLYLEKFLPQRHPAFLRMEEEARRDGFPIIEALSGQLCYLTAKLINARRIYELGSGFGYSTAWFAKALLENGGGDANWGEVWHVVWDEELSRQARGNLEEMGYADVVRFEIGEAVESLQRAEGKFDLILLDIDKEGYPAAVPHIEAKLRHGGVLIADNMLRDGRMMNESQWRESDRGIAEFTKMIHESPDWDMTISPLRDGVMVAQYKGRKG